MPTPKTPRRSSLGLIVLWMLIDEPMHVYRMQKQLEAQGKDRVVNVRSRATLYQALERLVRDGLVEVAQTERVEGYPDRVVYAVTAAGRDAAREWLREMLRTTHNEYPDFLAAVSILFALHPDEARAELEARAEKLASELADTEATLKGAPAELPRLFLLEEECRKAVVGAELRWVRGVIADLREGRLTWSEQWLHEIAETFKEADPQDQQERR